MCKQQKNRMFSKFFQSTASKVLAGVAAGYIVSNHCSNINLTDSNFYNQFINPFDPYKKQCSALPLCNECKAKRFAYQPLTCHQHLSKEWLNFLQSEKFVSDFTKEIKRRFDKGQSSGSISLMDDLNVPGRFVPDCNFNSVNLSEIDDLLINQTFFPDKGCELKLKCKYYVDSAHIVYKFDAIDIDSQMKP